ncbi:amino acid:proton antiporter [Carnobacterium divergens]|uniref:APC family permease n=1 Tax=Carnobacterium divergens TaxID=2748 RepID=UPI001072BC9E|nr:amino acid permease [Carnobacterium divergens]TFI65720.1 amino acid:proton antiporter [Carnobacterium divergens]TFI65825.1 amino acid:proton antiporter [Carnobacterium divergens]TFI80675.1 amino acid:proton antiporter [Carnobacterium divergens]TFI90740.1 amino acid:proton antiporter [Carnobacterium divergens]TFJ06625.1 amino acid:proton antiporter [Carnobacterium divergens]
MGKPKKKFKLFDAVLMSVCVVLVVESAAPSAAIGASQFFWWILLLVLFFIPYGFVSAELGTTYDDEGGIYDWVKKAFGRKWGGRVAWFYWINYPIWMASLAVLFMEVIEQIFTIQISTPVAIICQLIFIWLICFISCFPVSDSKWILNVAAFCKVFIMLSLGVLGIYHAVTKGVANDFSLPHLLPSFDLKSLSFMSVILFNFLGFEVVTSLASDMENPKKQIPQALIYGGLLIVFFYLLAAFGMGVAIPTEELSTSGGLVESFILLIGGLNPFVVIIGLLFMFTLIANLVSWALGVNYVAMYAAHHNDMPAVFGIQNKKNEMPVGASVINGIVASLLVIAAPLIPNENIFWAFFALNVVALLFSYILMFPAFLKLRKIDPDRERPFKVKAGPFMLKCITYVPMVLLIVTLFFSVVPLSSDEMGEKIPILIGTVVATIIGEICIRYAFKKKKYPEKEQK